MYCYCGSTMSGYVQVDTRRYNSQTYFPQPASRACETDLSRTCQILKCVLIGICSLLYGLLLRIKNDAVSTLSQSPRIRSEPPSIIAKRITKIIDSVAFDQNPIHNMKIFTRKRTAKE